MNIKRPVIKLFQGIDHVIDDALDNQEGCLLASLNDLRDKALKALRVCMGTADGWAWIAEYMIFYVVRRTIERYIDSKFEIKSLNSKWKSKVFKDPDEEFILGHGIPLYQLLNDSSDEILSRKPDICLLYGKKIILTIEVKTSVTKLPVLKSTLSNLVGIQKRGKRRPRSRAFFVTFGGTLEVRPDAILREYREFYNEKGRYVGRFDRPTIGTSIQNSSLFKKRDSRGLKMKLLRLEDCLRKVEELLEKLPI